MEIVKVENSISLGHIFGGCNSDGESWFNGNTSGKIVFRQGAAIYEIIPYLMMKDGIAWQCTKYFPSKGILVYIIGYAYRYIKFTPLLVGMKYPAPPSPEEVIKMDGWISSYEEVSPDLHPTVKQASLKYLEKYPAARHERVRYSVLDWI